MDLHEMLYRHSLSQRMKPTDFGDPLTFLLQHFPFFPYFVFLSFLFVLNHFLASTDLTVIEIYLSFSSVRVIIF